MIAVTIVIPTRNRPRPLARALASVARQRVPADLSVDVVVVDNSPEGNAAAVVEAAALPFAVAHRHVPRPGVATARNEGVAHARGDVVAFLDDDCAAEPTWLSAQVTTLLTHGADGSFGPRIAAVDGPQPPGAAWARATYTRDLGLPDGTDVSDRTDYLPLPGAAFVKARCFAGAEPFDPRLDDVGAEDVLLFRQLADAGHRFVWSPGARVTEYVAPTRIDAGFVMRRRYLSGQHRCLVPMLLDPPRRREMVLHMAKGAAAVALAGPVAVAGRALGRWPPHATGLVMSGLGKISWWRRNTVLYGRGHR